jgi:hypothetical protein
VRSTSSSLYAVVRSRRGCGASALPQDVVSLGIPLAKATAATTPFARDACAREREEVDDEGERENDET